MENKVIVIAGDAIQGRQLARMLATYGGIEKARVIESIEPPADQSPYDFLQNKFTPLLKAATEEQQSKLKKVFDEYGKGTLHSGSKTGPKVATHKQAVAIALHESGLAKSREEADKMVDDADKAEAITEKEEQRHDSLKKAYDHMFEKGGKNSGKRKPREGDPVLFVHPTSKEVVKGKIVKPEGQNKDKMHDVQAGDETHYIHEDDFIKDNSDKYRAMDDDKLKKEIAQLETFYNAEGDKMKKFYMKHELNTAKQILLARSSKGEYKNLYKKKMEKGEEYDNEMIGLSHGERMLATYLPSELLRKSVDAAEEAGELTEENKAANKERQAKRNISGAQEEIIEKAANEDGETSKTGAVIGQTTSGKNVYAKAPVDHARYKDFTKQDHNDAAKVHYDKTHEKGSEHAGYKRMDQHTIAADKMEKSDDSIDESMEKSLDAEIITLHSHYMNFEEFMTKAKEVQIGTVDKAGKYVKTAEGWKPVKTHGHIIKHDLEENKRHGDKFKHLDKNDFDNNRGSKTREVDDNENIFNRDKHRSYSEQHKQADAAYGKKKKITNIDEARDAAMQKDIETQKKRKEQAQHLDEVEKHNSKK